jgi:tetratricopeptide (TPR) repeat protein
MTTAHGREAALAWLSSQVAEERADAAANARLLRGRLLLTMGRANEARNDFEAGIGLTDKPGPLQFELARAHATLMDLAAAVDCLQLAVSWCPRAGDYWLELGSVLLRLDRVDEARESLQTARALLLAPATDQTPDTSEAAAIASATGDGQACVTDLLRCELRLSHALIRLGLFAQAADVLRSSVLHSPGVMEAWIALGNAELLLDNDIAAEAAYERAIGMSERPSAAVLLHHGVVCQNLGRWDVARAQYEQIMRLEPGNDVARWYLCQAELALQHWQIGWSLFSLRYKAGALKYRPMPFRPWDGRIARDDTLLVLADEGLGDEIMYASCLRDAMARVGRCILECEPRLEALFRRSFPEALVVGTDRSADIRWLNGLPAPDWQISSGDLPRLLRPDAASFEPAQAFLVPDPRRSRGWRDRLEADLGPGLKVGISWRGGTERTRTRARSLPLSQWAPILGVPGVQFVSLQYGPVDADLAELSATTGRSMVDYPAVHADYDDTAALVGALDLVISVCTAVIHLAGGLGKPVWVLAPYAPSWRYGAYNTAMPWYPQVRVMRKTRYDSWDELCHSVAADLATLTNSVA